MEINEKDPQLGNNVKENLLRLNIENPISSEFNFQEIKDGISKIISGLGLSLDCESIKESPERITKFYVHELFSGLDYNNFPKITFNYNSYNYSEPVISRNISFKSTCEHHCITMRGVTDRDVDNVTYKFGGQFLNEALKQQFYSSCIG